MWLQGIDPHGNGQTTNWAHTAFRQHPIDLARWPDNHGLGARRRKRLSRRFRRVLLPGQSLSPHRRSCGDKFGQPLRGSESGRQGRADWEAQAENQEIPEHLRTARATTRLSLREYGISKPIPGSIAGSADIRVPPLPGFVSIRHARKLCWHAHKTHAEKCCNLHTTASTSRTKTTKPLLRYVMAIGRHCCGSGVPIPDAAHVHLEHVQFEVDSRRSPRILRHLGDLYFRQPDVPEARNFQDTPDHLRDRNRRYALDE